jgi:hypothetical protein
MFGMPNVFLEKSFFRKKQRRRSYFVGEKTALPSLEEPLERNRAKHSRRLEKKTALALAQAREVPEELQFLGFYRLCYSTMQFLTEILC